MRRDDPIQLRPTGKTCQRASARFAACLIASSMVLAAASPVSAQTTAAPTAPAKPAKATKPKAAPKSSDTPAGEAPAKDPAAAQRSFDSGRAAYQAGKYDAAIQSMNAAMQVGGLEQRVLANALLTRGASFQKSGKPGQAISDLTSAMWLKDGLNASERAEAAQLRSQAYKDAGLTEPPASAVASGAPSATGTDTVVRNLETASTRTATAAAPVPAFNAVPSEGTSTPDSGLSGASVGKFFSNIFSPSQSSAPKAATQAAVAAPAALAAPPSTSTGPEVLPWSTTTAPATNPSLPAAQSSLPAEAVKPPPKPAPVKAAVAKLAAPTAAGQSTYRIQVAAVKSRDEASQVIAKLQDSGGVLAGSPSAVDETTFGSMGTFYRVRLGPFASAAATKAPCESLKAKGFDCLVTTN